MKKTNEKKALVLSAIAVITLIAVVVGATYAYFQAQGGGSGNTNVNVQTATTDNLSFQIGGAISITANQEDFGQDMPNKSGSTTASATLTANNATNNATRNYYVYLDITSNDFEYTTDDEQAELLLKITDPDGAEVTTLGSLERKTSGGVTGFDITTSTGLITIADNYEITSTGTVTQEWQIEVIFANLDSDQNANTGKTFSANLIIQEEKIKPTLADYIINEVYTGTDGDNGLYLHDGQGTYGAQEVGDNSYRYSGANPNNYVCFGSDDTTCPADNLYRIIGAFDDDKDGNYQIKLIKNTSIGNIAWERNGSNTWSSASLNTGTLNGTYLSGLETWASMIAEHDWEVGGMAYSNTNTAKQYYATELGNSDGSSVKYRAKIGLMYVTDYGYAASGNHWTTELYNYASATDDNWLYLGSTEWTISRSLSSTGYAFYVDYTGHVGSNFVAGGRAVRPSFYLASTVEISSGTGTSTDPFVLSLG